MCVLDFSWELLEVAAGVADSRELHLSSGRDMDMVQWTLASAAASGMNVMRMFAHGVRPDFPLQISPGKRTLLLDEPLSPVLQG